MKSFYRQICFLNKFIFDEKNKKQKWAGDIAYQFIRLKSYFWGIYIYIYVYIYIGTLAQTLECSPMAWETWVQSQVESYQRL